MVMDAHSPDDCWDCFTMIIRSSFTMSAWQKACSSLRFALPRIVLSTHRHHDRNQSAPLGCSRGSRSVHLLCKASVSRGCPWKVGFYPNSLDGVLFYAIVPLCPAASSNGCSIHEFGCSAWCGGLAGHGVEVPCRHSNLCAAAALVGTLE